ncbi:hypothetical protein [Pseudomonas veronii]|uniref:hypothetical protein n=1 Tax=Pseudomonas veronii TaxID=76761 RepID=UPI0007C83EF5|nr:hypothetical protein [Pseudomonas veronii]
MFIKGIKPQSVSDKPAYFAGLRAKLGAEQPLTFLAELPPDEAFALWRQHMPDGEPTRHFARPLYPRDLHL